MRTLIFDQFEFDSFASEETLEINIASRNHESVRQFRDLEEFVVACVGEDAATALGRAQPYSDLAACSSIREYLRRFADIEVPDPCAWDVHVLFTDDLEWDGVLATPEMFIRYHWDSTA